MTTANDILVVGGGPVGATLALALKNYGLRVTVLEARHPASGTRDARMLALSEGSRLILERLGVWPQLVSHATPIETIQLQSTALKKTWRMPSAPWAWYAIVFACATSARPTSSLTSSTS